MTDLIIGHVDVRLVAGAWTWTAGLSIDADGAPDAYAPPDSGLHGRDALGNAGKPGNWWGLVTDTLRADGQPIVQGASDPCPGYYVSPTALSDPHCAAANPRRYVDSVHVPYLAVPPELIKAGVHLGDVALVTYRGISVAAIVADVGPHGRIGEGSVALARALGIDPSPRHGGVAAGVTVRVWPGSRRSPAWPRTLEDVAQQVAQLAA